MSLRHAGFRDWPVEHVAPDGDGDADDLAHALNETRDATAAAVYYVMYYISVSQTKFGSVSLLNLVGCANSHSARNDSRPAHLSTGPAHQWPCAPLRGPCAPLRGLCAPLRGLCEPLRWLDTVRALDTSLPLGPVHLVDAKLAKSALCCSPKKHGSATFICRPLLFRTPASTAAARRWSGNTAYVGHSRACWCPRGAAACGRCRSWCSNSSANRKW